METKVSIIIANKVLNERIDIKPTYQLGKNTSTFNMIVWLSFVKNYTLLLNTSQYYVLLPIYIINFQINFSTLIFCGRRVLLRKIV